VADSASATRLDEGAWALLGHRLEARQRCLLLEYLDLLAHWNRSYNLTAVTDTGEMVVRHLLDSLSVLPYVGTGRLLDAGTGAGLPGIPLAVMRPDLEVTLLDSAGKRIRFLRHVQRQIALENVEIVESRLESHRPARPFDTVISRAFASLAAYATAARGVLATGGRLLAMKGRRPRQELQDLPPWLRVEAVERIEVPGLQAERHLVIMSVHP